MSAVKIFEVKDNVNFEVIAQFLDFYDSKSILDYGHIKIIIGSGNRGSQKAGDIDPLFLSYLLIFMREYPSYEVEIAFDGIETADRAYSLKDQLEGVVHLTKIGKIRLNGSYASRGTGEIRPISLNGILKQSQKFLPLMIIESQADVEKCFDQKYSQNKENQLWEEYHIKLKSSLNEQRSVKEMAIPRLIDLSSLSFFETCLMNLLVSEDLLPKKKKSAPANNQQLFERLLSFTLDISMGIRELAKNIVEHSTAKRGVISGRIFSAQRLAALKGSIESSYIDISKAEYYLDFNVVDLGKKSIRQTYLENLEINIKKSPFQFEGDGTVDLKLISEEYLFQDFFVIDIDKFSRLSHQQNKFISRDGLNFFTQSIVNEYSGFVKVKSLQEKLYIFNGAQEPEDVLDGEKFGIGTSYNCIIPVGSGTKQFVGPMMRPRNTKDAQKINMFLDLENYALIDIKSSEKPVKSQFKPIYNLNFKLGSPEDPTYKYSATQEIYLAIKAYSENYKNEIVVINAKQFEGANDSEWSKLLSALIFDFTDIIVFNISSDTVRNIIKLRRKSQLHSVRNFWSSHNRVLFYSMKSMADEYGAEHIRFGATLLTGENALDFDTINKNIWRHHYSFKKDMLQDVPEETTDNTLAILDSSKLFQDGKLTYFELLISNKDKFGSKLSLFEQSIQYSLNKTFDVYENLNTNNKGYRIVNTHFKLGSKIHIRDFYYAKRLFQNSFFTTPLAYLIAKRIVGRLEGLDELTIIGYEDYSSFLTSTVRSIVEHILFTNRSRFNNLFNNINHNTINKDGLLSKDVAQIKKSIIIIVPIVSSFSTSMKVSSQLSEILVKMERKFKRTYNILSPTLNVVLVGHRDDKSTFEEMATEELLGNEIGFSAFDKGILKDIYNWQSINKVEKIIKVGSFDRSGMSIRQNYMVPVYTEWHNADECSLCYSEGLSEEKCLIETGKASITPTLIFGFPKTKSSNILSVSDLNMRGSILYGNIRKGLNNYLYFTKSGEIVKVNKPAIKKWLEIIKKEVFDKLINANQKIVIVTPANGTKSNFIDLVNELVFEYTANCLSISLSEDYIENAESLYADGLHNADVVVFVDDVLSTTGFFYETNYIVKYIRHKIHTNKGIDYCLALINKMTYDGQDNLEMELTGTGMDGQLFYYQKLNNPSIDEPNNEFPLIRERDRYNYLSLTSSLDSIRQLFLDKIEKLRPVDISQEVPEKIRDDVFYFDKKLFQLLVLNRFYQLFETAPDNKKQAAETPVPVYRYDREKRIGNSPESFDALEEFTLKGLQDNVHSEVIEKYSHNTKFVLLKIICSTPLVYYQNIRQSAFHWLLLELEDLRKEMADLDKETLSSFFSISYQSYFSKFQKLKFLLKRSVQLKSNYIIHPEFFRAIQALIQLMYSEKDRLNEEFAEINNSIFSRLKALYQNTEYKPGKYQVFKYIKEIKRLVDTSMVSAFLSSIDEDELVYEADNYQLPIGDQKKNFEKDFFQLRDQTKYHFLSSKMLIYQLIALVKELTDEHETKSVRLEQNLSKLSYDRNSCKNGDFSHYVRLLKLENTAIIERFWDHFRIKETGSQDKPIELDNFIALVSNYENEPRYGLIVRELEHSCKDSFTQFLKLRSHIHNWSKDKEKIELKSKVNTILNLTSAMIGGQVQHAYFTVNFQNEINPEPDLLYVFEPFHGFDHAGDVFDSLLHSREKMGASLTSKMFHPSVLNDDDEALSNLEVIKAGGIVHLRDGIFSSQEIEDCTELKAVFKQNEFSLLVVRISDLDENGSLYAQAVLTFILAKGERIEEEKLRLLLLLRKALSSFVKLETANNTFIELLTSRSKDETQSKLRHGLEDYFSYQEKIIRKQNTFSLEDILILDSINRAIKGQIVYDANTKNNRLVKYSTKEISKKFATLLESNLIAGKRVTSSNYRIDVHEIEIITLDSDIFDVLFLELIINAKKHSPNIGAGIEVDIFGDMLIMRNNSRPAGSSEPERRKDGRNLCDDICRGLGYDLKFSSDPEKFTVTLKFK